MQTPREIIFRAKRKDNGEWVEGNYHYREWVGGTRKNIHYIAGAVDVFHYYQYEIDPATLSQFIGWKDSHRNRIFENDIVEIVSSSKYSYKYLIWWSREMNTITAIPLDDIHFNGTDYWYNNPNFNYSTFCLMLQDPWGDFSDIKVIGNLFDNYGIVKETLI